MKSTCSQQAGQSALWLASGWRQETQAGGTRKSATRRAADTTGGRTSAKPSWTAFHHSILPARDIAKHPAPRTVAC
jgi:hypothetical protein